MGGGWGVEGVHQRQDGCGGSMAAVLMQWADCHVLPLAEGPSRTGTWEQQTVGIIRGMDRGLFNR